MSLRLASFWLIDKWRTLSLIEGIHHPRSCATDLKGRAMHGRLTTSRRARSLSAGAAGLLSVLLAWSPVLAAVSWGDLHRVSTNYAYGWTQSLARTVSGTGPPTYSSVATLHQVFTRDVIGGEASRRGRSIPRHLLPTRQQHRQQLEQLNTAQRVDGVRRARHGSCRDATSTSRGASKSSATTRGSAELKFRRNTSQGQRDYWEPDLPVRGRAQHRPPIDLGIRCERVHRLHGHCQR